MRMLTTLIFWTFAATVGFAQDEPKTLLLFVDNYEIQPAQTGDVELSDTEERAKEFDESITKDEVQPDGTLSDDDLERLKTDLKTENIKSLVEGQVKGDETEVTSVEDLVAKTDLSQANLYIKFYKAAEWKSKYYDCCPRKQSYQCGVNIDYLSCQYKFPYGWCCPLFKVPIRTCNCRRCFRLCPYCIREGKCLQRWSFQSYLAVCWNKWWYVFVYFKTYLPSGCYCSIKECF